MKKILLLGSTGTLGHQVYHYLNSFDDIKLFNVAYRTKLNEDSIILDMKNLSQLDNLITEIKPDFIINSVGILIDGTNKSPENAIFINAYIPHHLAKIANETQAKLIHISTDCVFSGKKGEYIENDEQDGYTMYAKTKALGEITELPHLTLRTSIIGPELKSNGEGLFHWFMQQSGTIKGYTKSIWSGVTTLELTKIIKRAIDQNTTGLYHVTNGQSINKYDLLNLFKKYTGKDIEIIPVEGVVSDKSFIDTRKELDYQIPHYETMVKEMVENIKNNQALYAQYRIIHEE